MTAEDLVEVTGVGWSLRYRRFRSGKVSGAGTNSGTAEFGYCSSLIDSFVVFVGCPGLDPYEHFIEHTSHSRYVQGP